MSNSVDQRIVQMEFDNSSFERGVAKTMSSLDSLDKVLSGTKGYDALKKVAGQIDTSAVTVGAAGMSAAFDDVATRAESAFSRVTNAIGSVGKGFSIATALINTGIAGIAVHGGLQRAMDLSDAKFKLEQLKQSWDEVGPIIQHSVDDTAFGLGEAAVAAAGLAASGVTAQNGLAETLQATANLASVSGIEYSRVAQLMGQVASQGKLMNLQLESFNLAGINAAAMMANYWGMTEAEVNEMVHKGQIDLAMFVEAMNATLGEGAKKAQNTFKGSLANVKAALSRSTADMFEQGMKSLVPMFNAWRECINQVNKALNPLMRTWEDAEGVLHEGVLIRGFRDITAEMAAAFTEWANDSTGPENLARLIQELSDGLEGFFAAVAAGAKDFTYSILDIFAIIRELVRLFGELLSPIFMAMNDVFGGNEFANAMAAFRSGLEGILQVLVNSKVGTGYINVMRTAFALLFTVIQTLGKAAMSILGGIVQVATQLGTVAGRAFFAFFEVLNGIGLAIREFINADLSGFFDPLIQAANEVPILSDFVALLKRIPEAFDLLVSSFKGEEGVFERLQEFMGGVDSDGAKLLQDLGEAFGKLGAKLAEFGAGFKASAMQAASIAMEKFGKIAKRLAPVVNEIKMTIGNAWSAIVEAFQNAGFSFDPFFNLFDSFGEAFGKFIDSIADGDGLNFDNIAELFSGLKDGIGDFLQGIGEPILKFFGELGGKIAENLGGPFQALYDWAVSIQDPLDAIVSGLSGLIDSLINLPKNIVLPWGGTGEAADELADAVDEGYDAVSRFNFIVDAIQHPAATAGKIVTEAFNGIKNAINEFTSNLKLDGIEEILGTIGKMALLGGVAVTILEIAKFMESVEQLAGGFTDLLTNISKLADEMKKVGKAVENNLKVAVITQIAVSVGILAAALFAISKIDPERLKPAMISLLALIGVMTAVMMAIGHMPIDLIAMEVFSNAMRSLAISLGLVALAVAALGKLDEKSLHQGVVAMERLAFVMGVLAILTSKAKGLAGAGTALLEMAAAVAILTVVAVYLTYNWANVVPGAMMVLGLLGVLVLVAIALDHLKGFKVSGGGTLLMMAAALGIIGVVVALLAYVANQDIYAAITAAVIVGVLLGELAFIATQMTNMTMAGDLAASAASIVALCGGLVLIAGAVAMMAAAIAVGGSENVAAAWIAIAGMLIVLAGAVTVMAAAGPGAEIASAAMIGLCAAVVLVAAAIAVLSTMDVGAVAVAAAILVASIFLIVVAAAALFVVAEMFSKGVVALSIFAVAVGLGAVLIGAGAILLASALEKLAQVGPAAVDAFLASISALGQGLWNAQGDIAAGIAGLGAGVIAGLLAIIPAAAAATVQLVVGIAQAFLSAIPDLVNTALMGLVLLVAGIAEGLQTYGPALGQAVMQLGAAILEGLISMLTEAFAAILSMIDSLVETVTGTSPDFEQAARDLGQSAVEGLKSEMDNMDTEALDEVKRTAAALSSGKGELQSTGQANGAAIKNGMVNGVSGTAEGIQAQLSGIPGITGSAGAGAMDAIQKAMGDGVDMSNIVSQFEAAGVAIPEMGDKAGAGFATSMQESVAAVDVSDTLMQEIDSGAIVEKMRQAGIDAAEGFNSGFHDSAYIDGSTLDISSLEDSSRFSAAADACANAFTTALSNGLSSVASIASSAGSTAVSSFTSGAGGGWGAGYSVGYNLSAGVAAGMWAGYGSVAAAAASIIEKIDEVLRKKAEMRSPSKMTARVGRYLAEGLAVGMIDREQYVVNTAGNLMTSVLKSMSAEYVDALADDITENPTIRPILDLDDYVDGIQAMSDMMPTDQYMMAGRIMGYSAAASPFGNSSTNSAFYEINLHYTKDADANQMVEDLTRELHSKNLMEAH